jgi:signal transduction histidine kinase
MVALAHANTSRAWLARSTMKWMRRFCFGGMLLFVLANAADAAEPHRVLLLHSFGPDFSPWNTITPRFREDLRKQSAYPIDLYEASLQAERFGESPAPEEGPFIEYLNALFPARDLRLIVAMGAPTTRFVLRNRPRLFPSSPLLIASSDVRTYSDLTLTANDTACPTTYDPTVHIDHILQLLPNTTNIVVATGASPSEQFWTDLFRRSLQRFSPRVTFDWFTSLSADEMVKRVAELPPRSAIYYPTVRVDAHGVPQEGDAVLFRFIELERAPIFTHVDSHFGKGIVGGPMFSSREIAQKCAEVAGRILSGETPGDIKIPPIGLATPVYDWRQLRRWGISESKLPPGSEIQFREPSAWDQYKPHILAITTAILVQALLIAWLLHERQYRRRAERTARETFSELTQMNRMATAGELSAAIAHEVKQPITGMVTMANAALRWLSRENPDIGRAREAMNKAVAAGHQASDVITNVRGLFAKDTQEKVPTDINKLIRTVLGLVYMDLRKHSIETNVNLSEQLPTIFGNEVQLQQVILNLVMNAIESMNSAEPRILSIKTEMVGQNAVHVSVADTGSGISVANLNRIFKPMFTTKAHGMGMGLSICKSIIESHGGKIWVSAGASRGSIFQFELPVYQSGERKSDWSDRTSATLSGSPPLVADDEVIE